MKSVVIHDDTPSLYINNCELCIVNCEINVNLGAAGVAGATYFLFCHIYARERRQYDRYDRYQSLVNTRFCIDV